MYACRVKTIVSDDTDDGNKNIDRLSVEGTIDC